MVTKPASPSIAESKASLISDFLQNTRFGLRSLVRAPAFSFFTVLTLALGIGANTTVFTVVNTVLLHPLPARDPSRLVSVYTTDIKSQKQSGNLLPTSYQNLKDFQNRSTAFSSAGGFSPPLVLTLSENGSSERFFSQLVTSGYFDTL